jgi:hypothetical protein
LPADMNNREASMASGNELAIENSAPKSSCNARILGLHGGELADRGETARFEEP